MSCEEGKKMNRRGMIVAALLLGMLLGCSREPEGKGPQFGTKPFSSDRPVYRLAVHLRHNPGKLMQAYQPLIDYLNGRQQGARLALIYKQVL